MKKPKKLAIKKVTLRDLDQTALNAVAGGCCGPPTSPLNPTCRATCGVQKTCFRC